MSELIIQPIFYWTTQSLPIIDRFYLVAGSQVRLHFTLSISRQITGSRCTLPAFSALAPLPLLNQKVYTFGIK